MQITIKEAQILLRMSTMVPRSSYVLESDAGTLAIMERKGLIAKIEDSDSYVKLSVSSEDPNSKEANFQIAQIKERLRLIEANKKAIAAHRDILRTVFEELEAVIDSFSDGIDLINSGKADIEDGIDSISQHV